MFPVKLLGPLLGQLGALGDGQAEQVDEACGIALVVVVVLAKAGGLLVIQRVGAGDAGVDEVAPIDFEEADFSGDADFFTDIHTFYLDVNDGDAYAINLCKKEARRVSREDEVYIDAGKRGMLLPIEFRHVSAIPNVAGSDNNNTYSAKYKDMLWIFVNNDSVPVISYGTADTKALYEVPESFNFIAYFNREDGR